MKIALCISGYVGAMKKFHIGEELLIDISEGYSYIKENIIQDHDVDTFIHSFDINRKNEILNTYKPVSYCIEKQIKEFKINHMDYNHIIHPHANKDYSVSKVIFATQSQFYSRQKSIQLKSKYEKENNFKYDWVVIARMDMGYFKPFVFKDKDQSKVYLPGPEGTAKGSKVVDRLNDVCMFGGSEIMNKVGDFYDDIENCGLVNKLPGQSECYHAHITLANYFKRCGIWDKIVYYQNRPWGDPVWTPGDIGMLRAKPNVKTIKSGNTN